MMIQIGVTMRMPRLSTPEYSISNRYSTVFPSSTVLTLHRLIPSIAKDVDGEGEKDAGDSHEVMVLNGRRWVTVASSRSIDYRSPHSPYLSD